MPLPERLMRCLEDGDILQRVADLRLRLILFLHTDTSLDVASLRSTLESMPDLVYERAMVYGKVNILLNRPDPDSMFYLAQTISPSLSDPCDQRIGCTFRRNCLLTTRQSAFRKHGTTNCAPLEVANKQASNR